jgi:hypothetical protein
MFIFLALRSITPCLKVQRNDRMMQKKFKATLKKFLLINSFYSLEKYFTFDAKFDPDKN